MFSDRASARGGPRRWSNSQTIKTPGDLEDYLLRAIETVGPWGCNFATLFQLVRFRGVDFDVAYDAVQRLVASGAVERIEGVCPRTGREKIGYRPIGRRA
jgi:hypothetical protein